MPLFNITDYVIDEKISLSVFDVESLNSDVNKILDDNFVEICEGKSGSELSLVKSDVVDLYSNKTESWKMGATAEFFIHLVLKLKQFRQECLFINLEEKSIKKGFDGYYSKEGIEWIMESKSGSSKNSDVSHSNKVRIAMKDLENKVTGVNTKINPWKNAYAHASQYDVGTPKEIRNNIKKLSDDYRSRQFYPIEKFNIMPCGTVFLSGVWSPPRHSEICKDIIKIQKYLKGSKVYVICVTQASLDVFDSYINS